MDTVLSAAARYLGQGDPLGALKLVALREDAAGLALRGIAMAQLADFARAKLLLRRARRTFARTDVLARARCATAEAEVALAARELSFSTQALDEARAVFERAGDSLNALHAALLQARRFLLLGQVARAEQALSLIDLRAAPPMLSAIAELVTHELALRRGEAQAAQRAIERARRAALRSQIPALLAETERAARALSMPAAQHVSQGKVEPLALAQVEVLLASNALLVDGCRRALSRQRQYVSLWRRPVLFALLRALAEAWPSEVSRGTLVWAAFGARRVSESLRARLRVEIGRLRKELSGLARVQATADGFALSTDAPSVAVLLPPVEGAEGAVLALVSDGAAWSTSALALALGEGQRTVQRTLTTLAARGHVRSFGRGRSLRWTAAPASAFTTAMLLHREPTFA